MTRRNVLARATVTRCAGQGPVVVYLGCEINQAAGGCLNCAPRPLSFFLGPCALITLATCAPITLFLLLSDSLLASRNLQLLRNPLKTQKLLCAKDRTVFPYKMVRAGNQERSTRPLPSLDSEKCSQAGNIPQSTPLSTSRLSSLLGTLHRRDRRRKCLQLPSSRSAPLK